MAVKGGSQQIDFSLVGVLCFRTKATLGLLYKYSSDKSSLEVQRNWLVCGILEYLWLN